MCRRRRHRQGNFAANCVRGALLRVRDLPQNFVEGDSKGGNRRVRRSRARLLPPLQRVEFLDTLRTAAIRLRSFQHVKKPPVFPFGRRLRLYCRAGVHARPTEQGKHGGQPGKRGAALQQTPVGDDACIVPGTLRWRGCSREGHGPPLQTTENDRPNRTSAATRAAVGRGALTPPDPAAAQTPAGGINPAPTINGRSVPTGEPHFLRYRKPL